MLDYSTNDFQRQIFITGYDIDPDEQEIMVNYANNKSTCLPYSKEEEMNILRKMRQQVLDGKRFYSKTKEALNKLRFRDRMYKVLLAVFIGIIISWCHYNPINALFFCGLTIPANIYNIRGYRRNRRDLKIIKRSVEDYEKSLAFIENDEAFSNDKVMKPQVINKCSDRVKFIISQGIITDKMEDFKVSSNGVPMVNFHLVNDQASLTDPELIKRSAEDEAWARGEGYKEFNSEVPLINENTIGDMSHQELYDLYQLTNKENKGKVLVKLNEYKSESLNR